MLGGREGETVSRRETPLNAGELTALHVQSASLWGGGEG